MTNPNSAAQTAEQDPISEAIDILTIFADELRNSYTINSEDWTGEPQAKAEYDRTLRVVAALSKLRAPVAPVALHNALRWTAGTLQTLKIEADKITIDGVTRTIADILNGADAALANAPVAGEAVGHVYSMEALTPDGRRVQHATFTRDLPDGTAIYTAPQASAEYGAQDDAETDLITPESRANASGTVILPPAPSAYNGTGSYVGYAKSDLMAYARVAVLADRQQNVRAFDTLRIATGEAVDDSATQTEQGERDE